MTILAHLPESAAPKPWKPHSETAPYYMATSLHGLIKAALHLADHYGSFAAASGNGLETLLSVIEEKANLLSRELDTPVLGEGWEALRAEMDRDPTLGLRF